MAEGLVGAVDVAGPVVPVEGDVAACGVSAARTIT